MGQEEILGLLSSGQWVSGEKMASRWGVSRAAVSKQIKNLRKRGYEIESSTKKGYKLLGGFDLLDSGLIKSGLRTKWLGKELQCYTEVTSTNELARNIAGECSNGTVILAETQLSGRGRLSRPWASPSGGIWMTLILKPKIPLAESYRINMAVSVATAKAIQSLHDLPVRIKWPNDLLINEGKVCGLLMEIVAEVDLLEYALVGIGINANVDISLFPEAWESTSLSFELERNVSRSELIQRILLEIEKAYSVIMGDEIFENWRDLSATLGRKVRVSSALGELEGIASVLCKDGALIIETARGPCKILAGDCYHLRSVDN